MMPLKVWDAAGEGTCWMPGCSKPPHYELEREEFFAPEVRDFYPEVHLFTCHWHLSSVLRAFTMRKKVTT